MNVSRGPDGHGAPTLQCSTCHQAANQPASGVPGAPDWHLAPIRMAWEGLSPGELCRALLDPQRGGMRPDKLVAHLNTGLVRWAFAPGTNARGVPRSTPPLSHEEFVRHWLEVHAPLAHAVSGVRRYVQSHIVEERTRPDIPTTAVEIDGIAEL